MMRLILTYQKHLKVSAVIEHGKVEDQALM